MGDLYTEYINGVNIQVVKGSKIKIGERKDYKVIFEFADGFEFDVDAAVAAAWLPKSIRLQLHKHWSYKLTIKNGPDDMVTPQNLHRNVLNGSVLAYKHCEFYHEAIHYIYYGCIMSKTPRSKIVVGNHARCIMPMAEVWPRELFIHLKWFNKCDKHEDCHVWEILKRDGVKSSYCQMKIPWNNIAVSMGRNGKIIPTDNLPNRDCLVCLQCHECSISNDYCKRHKICKHKTSATPISQRIKMCK